VGLVQRLGVPIQIEGSWIVFRTKFVNPTKNIGETLLKLQVFLADLFANDQIEKVNDI